MKVEKSAYRLFNRQGKPVSYDDLLGEATGVDALLFGELHDNPLCHWLELELMTDLFRHKGSGLMAGAEMFESDTALIVQEYLNGLITEDNFESQARLWPNYPTDYRPILSFVRDKGIPFVATNIPRRYASIILRKGMKGLEDLSDGARGYIAPLPIPYDPDLQCYRQITEMMQGAEDPDAIENLPRAQAIKDATMAHFITMNWKEGGLFFHINGTYHSDNFEGIAWYLSQYRPGMKVLTVSSVAQDDITRLEDDVRGRASFILLIPSTMTRTY